MWLGMSPAPLWAVLAPSHGDGELAASGLLMCTLCKYVSCGKQGIPVIYCPASFCLFKQFQEAILLCYW